MITFPIADASCYYSQGDEDRFYGCISQLPEYVTVKWDGSALPLSLTTPISRDSFFEIFALFRRYGVPLCLLQGALPALREEDRDFVRKPNSSWRAALFECGKVGKSAPRYVSKHAPVKRFCFESAIANGIVEP